MEPQSISLSVSLPLVGLGAFTLLLSFCFCLYMWRLRRRGERENLGYVEKTFKSSRSSQTETCPVCLEDFVKGDKIAVCNCRHIFHTRCLNQWLQMRNVCPVCKAPVSRSARETTGLIGSA